MSYVDLQPSEGVDLMLDKCWANVYDGGPTFVQHQVNVLCLLRYSILHIYNYRAYTDIIGTVDIPKSEHEIVLIS